MIWLSVRAISVEVVDERLELSELDKALDALLKNDMLPRFIFGTQVGLYALSEALGRKLDLEPGPDLAGGYKLTTSEDIPIVEVPDQGVPLFVVGWP